MTDEQRANLRQAIRERSERMCQTPETALKGLVDMGMVNPDNSLTRTYGSERTDLPEHFLPDENIQPFAGISRGLPLGDPDDEIAEAVGADQHAAPTHPRQGPAEGPAAAPAGPAPTGRPDTEDPSVERGAEAGYEFWHPSKWKDATAYDRALWRGIAEAILYAVKEKAMREALFEIRILGEARVLHDMDADRNFSDSRQMKLVLDALA